jgi:hypothetical protein
MPSSTARTGGESVTYTRHAGNDGRQHTPCPLSVPCEHCRYAVSIGALLAQYSNLVAADSKLAAQCGASVKARDEATATSDAFLRDGSGSQCTLTRTSLPRMCGCAGCPNVSPMRTLRVPHAGPDVVDPTLGYRAEWCTRLTNTTQQSSTCHTSRPLPARTIAPCGCFLQGPCEHAQYPCEHQKYPM